MLVQRNVPEGARKRQTLGSIKFGLDPLPIRTLLRLCSIAGKINSAKLDLHYQRWTPGIFAPGPRGGKGPSSLDTTSITQEPGDQAADRRPAFERASREPEAKPRRSKNAPPVRWHAGMLDGDSLRSRRCAGREPRDRCGLKRLKRHRFGPIGQHWYAEPVPDVGLVDQKNPQNRQADVAEVGDKVEQL